MLRVRSRSPAVKVLESSESSETESESESSLARMSAYMWAAEPEKGIGSLEGLAMMDSGSE